MLTALMTVGRDAARHCARLGREPRELSLEAFIERDARRPGVSRRQGDLELSRPVRRPVGSRGGAKDGAARSELALDRQQRRARHASATIAASATRSSCSAASHRTRSAPRRSRRRSQPVRSAWTASPALLAAVDADVTAEQDRWRDAHEHGHRTKASPTTYRRQLAARFIYKFVVHALGELAPDSVPEADRSAGEMTWEKWPVSGGTEDWEVDPTHAGTPLGTSVHQARGVSAGRRRDRRTRTRSRFRRAASTARWCCRSARSRRSRTACPSAPDKPCTPRAQLAALLLATVSRVRRPRHARPTSRPGATTCRAWRAITRCSPTAWCSTTVKRSRSSSRRTKQQAPSRSRTSCATTASRTAR